MRLYVCGSRGSTPSPGREFVRYGGHTLCIALAHDGAPRPSLILDAGTGLRAVPKLLSGGPFRGTILLSHLHWDHTQGLPFFAAGDTAEAKVKLLMPSQEEPVRLLERMISPPFFPIGPRMFNGDWTFERLEPGRHDIEGFSVEARAVPHKGGLNFGYRISDGAATLTYMSDHSPVACGPGPEGLGEYHETALALAARTDLLVHDCQHTAEEFPRLAFLGHSAVEYALGLAQRAGAAKLLVWHHDPNRTDDALDRIVDGLRSRSVAVEAARDGMIIDLPA